MIRFKVVCPTGYNGTDSTNDNVDVNIVMENGDIYFATLFTLENIQFLMTKDNTDYFWATDMIVVKNLDRGTILAALSQLIQHKYLEYSTTKIGTIDKIFSGKSFDEIKGL